MSREEYLEEWFNFAFRRVKWNTTDKQSLKEWFLKHADICDFYLRLEYLFQDVLQLTVFTLWEGCDDMCWWTTGEQSKWEGNSNLCTLKQIEEKIHDVDFTCLNKNFLELLIGYLHSQVLPEARHFEQSKYSNFCTTETPSGFVTYN